MTNGSITLNGVTDAEMGKIFDFKGVHEGEFTLKEGTPVAASGPGAAQYNNVNLGWANPQSMKTVLDFVQSLNSAAGDHH